jgi:hypothetical protein
MVAFRKKYVHKAEYLNLVGEYNECSAMLRSIERSLDSE